MVAGKLRGENILSDTLERVNRFYKEKRICPGDLIRVSIKPQYILVKGSGHECGISSNITNHLLKQTDPSDFQTIAQIQEMINRPLFEAAATGIKSENPLLRSLGVAALSALSQRFLSCTTVRKRGYLSECWIATDPFIVQYPILSRIVTMDDEVALFGSGPEIRDLIGRCHMLHVIGTHSSDTYSTLLIDSIVSHSPDNIIVHEKKPDTGILRSADVIFINASALIDNTFDDLMQYSADAHLVGLCGLGCSIIPDVFFDRGIHFITSFRITDPRGFENTMTNEFDMEYAMKIGQKQYLMMNPVVSSGKPVGKNIIPGT
jgi:uncharacterized protein (DUF4213/DUF364 family)